MARPESAPGLPREPPRTLFPPALFSPHRRTLRRTLRHHHRAGPLGPRPAILPRSVVPPPAGAGTGQSRCVLLRHVDADRLLPRAAGRQSGGPLAAIAIALPARAPRRTGAGLHPHAF